MKAAALTAIVVIFFLAPSVRAEETGATGGAVITSDELELRDNGQVTIFRGHVVLTQPPYVLHADEMTRWKADQRVEASGHVEGIWTPPSGERLVATGQRARYDEVKQVTELWGQPKVTRWETARDTSPVVITALRFVADQNAGVLYAHERVNARQGEQMSVRADEAKYVQGEGVIHLWGPSRVFVHWRDSRGTADFDSERGFLWLNPKRARLVENVRGHVVMPL